MLPASSLSAALGAHKKSLATQFLTQFLGIHGEWQAHGDGADGDLGVLRAVGRVELDGHALWCKRRGQERLPTPARRLCCSQLIPYLGNGSNGSLQHRGVLSGGDERRRVGDARESLQP